MFVAFFESFKYVGHLYPVAIFRIFLGYFYFHEALAKVQGDYLTQPRLAAQIEQDLPLLTAPDWFVRVLEGLVVPQWQIFAYTITYCEFLIGISFLVGFLVRPVSLVAVALALFFLNSTGPMYQSYHFILLMCFLMILLVGGGRCLGFDYFFYKRQRGIWW